MKILYTLHSPSNDVAPNGCFSSLFEIQEVKDGMASCLGVAGAVWVNGQKTLVAKKRFDLHRASLEVIDRPSFSLFDGTFSHDYKVGDRFVVAPVQDNLNTFDVGSIVELFDDDYSRAPLFRLIEGECEYANADGEAGAYFPWGHLEVVKND